MSHEVGMLYSTTLQNRNQYFEANKKIPTFVGLFEVIVMTSSRWRPIQKPKFHLGPYLPSSYSATVYCSVEEVRRKKCTG
jgi:hypothetical protein